MSTNIVSRDKEERCAPAALSEAGKIATHLFYFNTEDDWQEEWGGETLILDSARRLARHSNPSGSDQTIGLASESTGMQERFA